MLRLIALATPWIGFVLIVITRRNVRAIAAAASLVTAAASIMLLRMAPSGTSLDESLMALYACLSLGATLVIPKRDCNARTSAGILWMLGSTLLAYSTGNLMVLLLAWIVSAAPFFAKRWWGTASWRPRGGLLLSGIALAAAVGLMVAERGTASIDLLKADSPGGTAVFSLLVLAVMFRKGIFPVHAWVADAVETGPAVPTALLLNGHFGAMLVAKVIVPLFPRTSENLFPVLSYLALVTALYAAIRGLAENSPRRLLAYVALSQSACILAGLESRTAEGVTGALVHWFVVTVSTMGLFGVLRLLEVRFGENLTAGRYLGLAEHAPRLAVFFAIFGFALVGLPGTLSFCSQDLLIQGTLASHKQTGFFLPLATAMNAVTFFRLFARLFLGKRRTGFTAMADALPRERWALGAGVLFVVLGGIFPSAMVTRRSAEAQSVEQALAAVRPSTNHLQPLHGSSKTRP